MRAILEPVAGVRKPLDKYFIVDLGSCTEVVELNSCPHLTGIGGGPFGEHSRAFVQSEFIDTPNSIRLAITGEFETCRDGLKERCAVVIQALSWTARGCMDYDA